MAELVANVNIGHLPKISRHLTELDATWAELDQFYPESFMICLGRGPTWPDFDQIWRDFDQLWPEGGPTLASAWRRGGGDGAALEVRELSGLHYV